MSRMATSGERRRADSTADGPSCATCVSCPSRPSSSARVRAASTLSSTTRMRRGVTGAARTGGADLGRGRGAGLEREAKREGASLPRPSLAAVREPPCSSASCFASARPIPSPPWSRASASAAWENIVKMFASAAAGIPIPESTTRTRTAVSSSQVASTRTVPPGSVYRAAFERRFVRICASRTGSAYRTTGASGRPHLERVPPAEEERPCRLERALHDRGEGDQLGPEADLPVRDPGDVEEVVDQPDQVGHLPLDHLSRLCGTGAVLLAVPEARQDLRRVPDRGERVSQLVREGGEELVLPAVDVAELLLGPAPLGHLHGERGVHRLEARGALLDPLLQLLPGPPEDDLLAPRLDGVADRALEELRVEEVHREEAGGSALHRGEVQRPVAPVAQEEDRRIPLGLAVGAQEVEAAPFAQPRRPRGGRRTGSRSSGRTRPRTNAPSRPRRAPASARRGRGCGRRSSRRSRRGEPGDGALLHARHSKLITASISPGRNRVKAGPGERVVPGRDQALSRSSRRGPPCAAEVHPPSSASVSGSDSPRPSPAPPSSARPSPVLPSSARSFPVQPFSAPPSSRRARRDGPAPGPSRRAGAWARGRPTSRPSASARESAGRGSAREASPRRGARASVPERAPSAPHPSSARTGVRGPTPAEGSGRGRRRAAARTPGASARLRAGAPARGREAPRHDGSGDRRSHGDVPRTGAAAAACESSPTSLRGASTTPSRPAGRTG